MNNNFLHPSPEGVGKKRLREKDVGRCKEQVGSKARVDSAYIISYRTLYMIRLTHRCNLTGVKTSTFNIQHSAKLNSTYTVM